MFYSIREVAKKVNLTAYTIRYYEKEGILPFIERDSQGNRLFSDSDIEWLNLVCCLRNTGMPISMIKHYVDLYQEGDETITKRRQIMFNQKQSIEEKIDEFNGYLRAINKKVEYYDALLVGGSPQIRMECNL